MIFTNLYPIRHYKMLSAQDRYWLKVVVGAVLSTVLMLNVLVIVFVNRHEPNSGYRLLKKKWQIANNYTEATDRLIVGDSSGNQGLVTAQFEKVTGQSAINLCTYGNLLLVDDIWFIEHFIQSNRTPKNVLLVHVYDVWKRETPDQLALAQVPLPIRQRQRFTSATPTGPRWFATAFSERYLPLFTRRLAVTAMITEPWRWFSESTIDVDEGGYMRVDAADPKAVASNAQFHRTTMLKSHFEFRISIANRWKS